MKKNIFISIMILVVISILGGWTSYSEEPNQKVVYPYNDPNITFSGRVFKDTTENVTYFNWTCSGFEFRFEGNKVEADLRTILVEENGSILYPWVAVFVDDFDEPYKLIELKKEKDIYTLFESKEFGTHNIRVVKRTEALHSKTGLAQIAVYGNNAKIEKLPLDKQYKIEFIGDSITCGYGNESTRPEDGFQTPQENGWEAFAAKTARRLNADFNCVCISGIGVYSNWTPVNQINDKLLMPEIYSCTDTYLDVIKKREITSWDFESFKPDLIVINLGTNDFSYIQYDYSKHTPVFKQKYIDFLKQVRQKNGENPKILCTILLPIEEPKPIFEEIIKEYKTLTGDENIDIFFLSKPYPEDGVGGSWHPTVKTHERMAQELTTKMREWLNW